MIGLFVEVALADPVDALQSQLEQARFFIRKRWYDDALELLERAVAEPEGRIDPEAWYLLAGVRYQLCDIEGARQAASRAHSYSRTDDQLQQASTLSLFLDQQFGVVTLQSPYPGMAGRLDIELESVLFDVELKEYLGRLKVAYDDKVVLPVRLGLPAGVYTINGHAVNIEPGAEFELVLPPSDLAPGRAPTAQLARAELAAGMSFWFGADVKNLAPAGTLELSATQPLGPIVAGVLLEWAPRRYETAGGWLGSTVAPSLGGRIGVEWTTAGDWLTVRPSLGYRYGYVPGIERTCAAVEAEFSCGEGPEDLAVYAIGRAHIPFAELALDTFDRRRKSGLGFGVKVVGERAFGTLARQAEATATDGSRVVYSVEEEARPWSATGVRFVGNFSYAF